MSNDQIEKYIEQIETWCSYHANNDPLAKENINCMFRGLRQALERQRVAEQRASEAQVYRAIAGPLGELRTQIDGTETLSQIWKEALDIGLLVAGQKARDRVMELLAAPTPEDEDDTK